MGNKGLLVLNKNIILKKDATGDEVLQLQKALWAMGFNPKEIDGNFGHGTEAAVRALQEAAGLKVNGIVGEETWNFIMNMTWNETPEPFSFWRNPKSPYQRHLLPDYEPDITIDNAKEGTL
jgi:hypothetical protein